jgi:hypothetical protein
MVSANTRTLTMHKLMTVAALVTVTVSSAAFSEEPFAGPAYVGDRSNNPEQETFAEVGATDDPKTLAFIGPARSYGSVTGDPEKDTTAYRPLLTNPEGTRVSLNPQD